MPELPESQLTPIREPQPTVRPLAFIGEPEALAKLFAAIAKAQGEFQEVTKDTAGQKGNQTYKYATLAALRRASLPALSKNGISVNHFPVCDGSGEQRLHRMYQVVAGHGAVIQSFLDFQPAGDIKEYGSQTTYLRRYMYQAFGVLDGDTDADSVATPTQGPNGGMRAQPPAPKQRQKPQPKPQAQQVQETAAKLAKQEEERKAEEKPPKEPYAATNEQELSEASEGRIITLAKALGYRQKAFASRVYELMGCAYDQLDETGGRQLIGHLEDEAQSQGILVDG